MKGIFVLILAIACAMTGQSTGIYKALLNSIIFLNILETPLTFNS
jgi:hypothetical protein